MGERRGQQAAACVQRAARKAWRADRAVRARRASMQPVRVSLMSLNYNLMTAGGHVLHHLISAGLGWGGWVLVSIGRQSAAVLESKLVYGWQQCCVAMAWGFALQGTTVLRLWYTMWAVHSGVRRCATLLEPCGELCGRHGSYMCVDVEQDAGWAYATRVACAWRVGMVCIQRSVANRGMLSRLLL